MRVVFLWGEFDLATRTLEQERLDEPNNAASANLDCRTCAKRRSVDARFLQ
jgi:hypothetical protein